MAAHLPFREKKRIVTGEKLKAFERGFGDVRRDKVRRIHDGQIRMARIDSRGPWGHTSAVFPGHI
jgi:hypothetical protein